MNHLGLNPIESTNIHYDSRLVIGSYGNSQKNKDVGSSASITYFFCTDSRWFLRIAKLKSNYIYLLREGEQEQECLSHPKH